MKYRLVITTTEDNPSYEADLKAYEEASRWNNQFTQAPLRERIVKTLETVLTEDEFIAVRNAVLERF